MLFASIWKRLRTGTSTIHEMTVTSLCLQQ